MLSLHWLLWSEQNSWATEFEASASSFVQKTHFVLQTEEVRLMEMLHALHWLCILHCELAAEFVWVLSVGFMCVICVHVLCSPCMCHRAWQSRSQDSCALITGFMGFLGVTPSCRPLTDITCAPPGEGHRFVLSLGSVWFSSWERNCLSQGQSGRPVV